MKIFITGGCGYIGFSLIEELLKNDDVELITCYDNLSRRNPNFFLTFTGVKFNRVNFIQGDILDFYSLDKALQEQNIVIHVAGKVSTPFSESNRHEFDQVNNWGSAALVSAIEKVKNITKLIYISSAAVYGNSNGLLCSEDSNTKPNSSYGISKLKAEKHIKRLENKVQTNILRVANVYGANPCIRYDSVINKLMFDAHYLGKIEKHGSGNQKRAFINIFTLSKFVSDCAIGNISPLNLYNLVGFNASINQIVGIVNSIYPNVDIISLEQHLEMRSIAIESMDNKYKSVLSTELKSDLLKFKQSFRFSN